LELLIVDSIYVLSDTKRWTSPSTRIIIIGDAAHAMSPASAQGAGMAWEDAYTLAYALSKSDSSDETNSSSIKIWEAHRREHLQRVVKYAQFVENTRKPSPNYLLQKIKEWRTWAVLKYSGEEGLAGWMYRYNGETEIGALL
jgi:2-polyprenyl-6-methoxyphenol hydroxylase-like FAD-dependent oxidoreductase